MQRSPTRGLSLLTIAAIGVGCAHSGGVVAAPPRGEWTVVPHVELVSQKGEADCGPAALATALGRWGVSLPPGDPGIPKDKQGVTAGALRDEARRLGFTSFVFEGAFTDLAVELGAGRPVVVGLVYADGDSRLAHFAVVVGRDARADRWLLADPARGVREVSADALRGDWGRAGWVTLVLLPKAEGGTVATTTAKTTEEAPRPRDGAVNAAL
jgi:ABC-type bacteriocin/lantibiotic exporter with double-glycine peptidase domain